MKKQVLWSTTSAQVMLYLKKYVLPKFEKKEVKIVWVNNIWYGNIPVNRVHPKSTLQPLQRRLLLRHFYCGHVLFPQWGNSRRKQQAQTSNREKSISRQRTEFKPSACPGSCPLAEVFPVGQHFKPPYHFCCLSVLHMAETARHVAVLLLLLHPHLYNIAAWSGNTTQGQSDLAHWGCSYTRNQCNSSATHPW